MHPMNNKSIFFYLIDSVNGLEIEGDSEMLILEDFHTVINLDLNKSRPIKLADT